LENVLFRDLNVGIDASATADLAAQRWSNLIIENNDVGVDLGNNAYESLFEGFEIVGGNGVGIRERSSRGNTHVGHTIATGSVGLEVSGSTNRSTFAGLYLDSGDSISSSGAGRTLTVGGNLVSAIPTGERIGGRVSRLRFKKTRGGQSMSVDIPVASSYAAMVWRSKCEPNATSCIDEPGAWLLRRWPSEKKWGFVHSLTGAKPLRWDDSTSATPGAVTLQLDPVECSASGNCP
jgi:hypothetical protein